MIVVVVVVVDVVVVVVVLVVVVIFVVVVIVVVVIVVVIVVVVIVIVVDFYDDRAENNLKEPITIIVTIMYDDKMISGNIRETVGRQNEWRDRRTNGQENKVSLSRARTRERNKTSQFFCCGQRDL